MGTPLLTIGIPLRNEARYIRQTLQSLLDQSFRDFRVVISENCSEDDTYTIVKEFTDRDDRFELIRQPALLSVIDNFRFVMNAARTPYFMWLGGHDLILDDYLSTAVSLLNTNPDVSLVYPLVVPIDKEGNIQHPTDYRNDDLNTNHLPRIERLTLVARNTFACMAMYGVTRTPQAKSIPFRKMIGADHLIIFHLAVFGEVIRLNEPGMHVRFHRTETYEQKHIRYVHAGIIPPDDLYSYENHALNYFSYVINCPSLKFVEKAVLLYRLKNIFRHKFHVTLKGLTRFSLYKLIRV